MRNMSKPLVLFDLDGTLVNLNPGRSALDELRNEVFEFAERHGVVPSTRSIFGMYEELRESGLGGRASALISAAELIWAEESAVPLFDLASIRPAVPWGIVTNNGAAAVAALLDQGTLFDAPPVCVVSRDNDLPLKPDSAPLKRAIDLAGGLSNFDSCTYVGDSAADAEAFEELKSQSAEAAKLQFLSVLDRPSVEDLYQYLLVPNE